MSSAIRKKTTGFACFLRVRFIVLFPFKTILFAHYTHLDYVLARKLICSIFKIVEYYPSSWGTFYLKR